MKFFDSLFRFDSPFMLKASRVASLIILNLLWLVCCIPVVTIGPATVAMHHVLFQYHTGRSDQVFKPFFHAFRRDFLQGAALGIPVTIVCVLLGFNGLYIYGNHPDGFHPLWIPFVLMLLITAAMIIYGFPLLARYRLTLGQVIRNALIFFLRNPKFSFFAMLLYFLPVLLFVFVPNLFANLLFFWVLLGASTAATLCDKRLLKLFAQEEE